MKKLLIILMAALLATSLFGCGRDIGPTEKAEENVMVPPAEEPPAQNPSQNEGTDGPVVEEERDAGGNVIKKTITGEAGDIRVYEYTSEGYEAAYTEYDPDGNVVAHFTRVYNENNPLVYTETNQAGETCDVICDENGNPEKKNHHKSDGGLLEEWFDGEMIARRRWVYADGNVFDVEYENDAMVKETITWADGATETNTYENEVIVSKVHESTVDDGRHRTSSCSYVDGVLEEEIVRFSDGVVEITRYTNEVKTFFSYEYTDGTYDKRTYNESGLLTYQESYIAAWNEFRTITFTVGSNGLYTYSIHQSNDGYVEEVFYDANGNKASWQSVHTDGSEHHGIFDASGAYVEQKTEPSGDGNMIQED